MDDSVAFRGVPPISRPTEGDRDTLSRGGYTVRDEGTIVTPKVLIDGIFFQYLNSGIARVWRGLLEEWAKSPAFAENLLVLDRAGTAPRVKGLRYLTIKAHDYAATGADSFYLQSICDQEEADLFVSTYYTTPTTTPSIFFGYDMIPEMTGADLSQEVWREKHRAIEHAGVHVMISHSSARDLERLFPAVKPGSTIVAHCGVAPVFRPANGEETAAFRRTYGVTKPYFLVVGDRNGIDGYKNGFLVFRALSRMPEAKNFELVCVGGQATIEPEFKALDIKARMVQLNLNDDDLRIAYSGAAGLIYPSRYEGFGLPILEAMACGCPVITCRNSSIPEIAGDAALYVGEDAADELADAMRKILDPEQRRAMIAAGLEQAQDFTLARIADTVRQSILTAPLEPPAKVWTEMRGLLKQLQEASNPIDVSLIGHAGIAPETDRTKALEAALREARRQLDALQTSPFWKLRRITLQVLRGMGLTDRR